MRWPECGIKVMGQRPDKVGSDIGDLKDHIKIYKRLNAEPGIEDEDHAMVDLITKLDCRHFRNFARNWTPREVENLVPQNRRRICGQSLNEQLIAQYFVRLRFTKRAGLGEKDGLRRMRLMMPYRTDEFITNLFEFGIEATMNLFLMQFQTQTELIIRTDAHLRPGNMSYIIIIGTSKHVIVEKL